MQGFDLALENGKGVFEHDGKMVDAPTVDKARDTIRLANVYRLMDD